MRNLRALLASLLIGMLTMLAIACGAETNSPADPTASRDAEPTSIASQPAAAPVLSPVSTDAPTHCCTYCDTHAHAHGRSDTYAGSHAHSGIQPGQLPLGPGRVDRH